MTDQGSTYSDPAVLAAIREETRAATITGADLGDLNAVLAAQTEQATDLPSPPQVGADLTERGNWIRETVYTDPEESAALIEAATDPVVNPRIDPATRSTADLADRGNWTRGVTRRIESTNGGAGGRYVTVGVAASVAVGFATDVADAVSPDPGDRIGDHYRADGVPTDFCGYCQNPNEPDEVWPCDAVRKAVGVDPGVLATLRADIGGLRTTLTAATNSCTRLEGENDDLRAQVEIRDARIRVLEEAGRLVSEGFEAAKEQTRRAVEGREQDAISYRVQLAQMRGHRDELAAEVDAERGKVAALTHDLIVAQERTHRSDLIDPTPGQITAYIRDARKVLDRDELMIWSDPAAVRAGLAAVQWALLNPTTGGETITDVDDARPGDIITVTGTIRSVVGRSAVLESGGGAVSLNAPGLTITRPAPPLPTVPGSVIEATNPYGDRVTLVLSAGDVPPWFTISEHRQGERRFFDANELTAVRVLSTPDAP